MKSHYDFSQGAVGKRFQPQEGGRVPVYLDALLANRLREQAAKSGKDPSQLLNELVQKSLASVS
jgi:hypothetical protein